MTPPGLPPTRAACSYESGLNRGFVHYEDYPITPLFLLGRTVAGTWIHTNILRRGDFYNEKWTRLQSRDAREITGAFLDWLRPGGRVAPFSRSLTSSTPTTRIAAAEICGPVRHDAQVPPRLRAPDEFSGR